MKSQMWRRTLDGVKMISIHHKAIDFYCAMVQSYKEKKHLH